MPLNKGTKTEIRDKNSCWFEIAYKYTFTSPSAEGKM